MSKFLYSLIAIAFLLVSWRVSSLSNALEKEELAHIQTQQEVMSWKAIANKAASDAKNIQSLAKATLLREEKARILSIERAELVKSAQSTQQRKPWAKDAVENTSDKGGIIDDDTRKKVAARINRTL